MFLRQLRIRYQNQYHIYRYLDRISIIALHPLENQPFECTSSTQTYQMHPMHGKKNTSTLDLWVEGIVRPLLPCFLHSIPYFFRQQADSGSRSDQLERFKGMVLATQIMFITSINNRLLWIFTGLNAAEVIASTLHSQLSPSIAYALITICILSFQLGKSMSTLL